MDHSHSCDSFELRDGSAHLVTLVLIFDDYET
jgi:hypothetical protein